MSDFGFGSQWVMNSDLIKFIGSFFECSISSELLMVSAANDVIMLLLNSGICLRTFGELSALLGGIIELRLELGAIRRVKVG